ncbi:MAG: hypothetical protein AAB366_00485 [Patescibacteria group bacterium]
MRLTNKIKFYSAEEWVSLVKKFGLRAILKHRDYRELFYCYPLLILEIVASGHRILMGKLLNSDDPFDVVFLPETLHNIYRAGQYRLKGSDGIWIQFKEIKSFTEKNKIDIDKWADFVRREYIDKIKKGVKLNPPGGILHLHNRLLFNPIKKSKLENALMGLKIPFEFPYKYVSLTIETTNAGGGDWRALTYQLHPGFKFIFDMNQENYLNTKHIELVSLLR